MEVLVPQLLAKDFSGLAVGTDLCPAPTVQLRNRVWDGGKEIYILGCIPGCLLKDNIAGLLAYRVKFQGAWLPYLVLPSLARHGQQRTETKLDLL